MQYAREGVVEGMIVYRRELKVDRDLLVLEVDVRQFGEHPLLDVPEVLCTDAYKNWRLSKHEGGSMSDSHCGEQGRGETDRSCTLQ